MTDNQHNGDLRAQARRRLQRAGASLEGLATGDAFGETFFTSEEAAHYRIEHRTLQPGMWRWTDDTAMALTLVATLDAHAGIDRDMLANGFGLRYRLEPARGYGTAMHGLLPGYVDGPEWRSLAPRLFGGSGSFGNGAAMRVAPLGAYFADDLERAATEAATSAEVTHTHREGVAGAVAVAVAAALASAPLVDLPNLHGEEFLQEVASMTPDSQVALGLQAASRFPADTDITTVAREVGSGWNVTAQDTVPFALWCAAHHLHDFREALWTTVAGLGDRDTTCATVGGVLGARSGTAGIPAEWLGRREPLPRWVARLTRGWPVDDPVNIDADAANANWLRIVSVERAYKAGQLSADDCRQRISELAECAPECVELLARRSEGP